jgi:predicted Zn-dependent protease with MMP-like domain/Flp pilus assembly protein TadD
MTTNMKETDEDMDPRLVAGWQALEGGDVETARAAAKAYEADGPLHVEALMLEAACQREDDDTDGALATLAKAAKGEPDWCTPELWMAELLLGETDRLDEALPHARRALDLAEEEDEYLAAMSTKAAIELGLDRPTEARKTLEGLPPADTVLDDVAMTLDLSQLLIEAGNVADARARLETLVKAAPDEGDAWYWLGVAAEAGGDEDRKRAAWLKTRELDVADAEAAAAHDHEHHDHDHHDHDHDHDHDHEPLTEEMLVVVAEETLEELPDQFRELLGNVPIVVAERPALADVEKGLDPRVLGLFNGAPHGENGSTADVPGVTEIVLFRQNLERVAGDEDELRDEIKITLLHEAGHFFGLDEEGLAKLGLD